MSDLDIQGAWDPDAVRRGWPTGIENEALLARLWSRPVELTAQGARGPVLEVAAAEALHACELARLGFACVVVEPSAALLQRARTHGARYGVHLDLVRGIGETLPLRDGVFDRVLCDSALDHFAAPELGLREMRRVLAPDGRLVLSFVNYAGLGARISRTWYRIDRACRPHAAARARFWDSPVPHEHTFECTYRNMLALCERWFELERAIGTTLLFGVPGWGALLRRLPAALARLLLRNTERVARRLPSTSDVVFTVWRPRRRASAGGDATERHPR